MSKRGKHLCVWLASCVGVLFVTDRVLACAVCFGDPESEMAKGAVAGVLVLVSVVGFVLICVAGTGLRWVHRSRRLAGMEQIERADEGSQ